MYVTRILCYVLSCVQLSDHYRIMQITEEMISGTSASRTSALVTALVQFIIRYAGTCLLPLHGELFDIEMLNLVPSLSTQQWTKLNFHLLFYFRLHFYFTARGEITSRAPRR